MLSSSTFRSRHAKWHTLYVDRTSFSPSKSFRTGVRPKVSHDVVVGPGEFLADGDNGGKD